MHKLYRFSPILTEEHLKEAIYYTAEKTTELCEKIIGKKYLLSSLSIFSHYPDEFESLKRMAFFMGELVRENNGPFLLLHKPIKIGTNEITRLRIRRPDPYRMQVGCADYDIPDYLEFKKIFLEKYPQNLNLITRREYEMIEFSDPDLDVLGYVVSKTFL